MTERVVITGMGLATPLGMEVDVVWRRLVAGERAVAAPERRPTAPCGVVGEIAGATLEALRMAEPELAAGDRRSWFGVAAGEAALRHAHLDGPNESAGVVLGSGPGVHRLEDVGKGAADTFHPESLVRVGAARPAEILAARHGLGGPVHAVTTACSASNQALGMAFRMVRRGECPFVVAGGSDSMVNPVGLVFFVLLGASAKVDPKDPAGACRPFDRKRTGLVMGEGAGCVVLESLTHAKARDATILAEMVGYGSSLDAYRTTAPPRDGRGAVEAMRAAIDDGHIDKNEVDFVNAHGTGTKRNDSAEVHAIRTVFGGHAEELSVSSSKGAMGHLLSGAAAVTFVLSVKALIEGVVPPTANLENADSSMDLDFVPGTGRAREVRATLTNSFAFGGQNAVTATRRYLEDDA